MRTIGPYQVLRELGRGGMGVVYEVLHPGDPAPRALKLILEGQAGPDALARFGREAQVLARVSHPHVLRIFELGRAPEGPYLVMEKLGGETLQQLLRRGPLAPRRAAELVRDLADAVAAIHAQGVLHRDLKPENAQLTPEGRVVLLDFGLARDGRSAEALTRTGQVLGTPAYMSPEQADGQRALAPATDVYGLGAVLCALLTGEPPYPDGPLVSVLKRVLTEEPRWPRSVRPEVPAALDAICRRAMAREPEARYPEAAALRAELEAFLAGPPARPGRGGRAVVAAGLAVAAVLAGVAAFVLSRGSNDPPVAPEQRVAPSSPPPDAEAEAAAALGLRDLAGRRRALVAWLERHREHPRAHELEAALVRDAVEGAAEVRTVLGEEPLGPLGIRWIGGPGSERPPALLFWEQGVGQSLRVRLLEPPEYALAPAATLPRSGVVGWDERRARLLVVQGNELYAAASDGGQPSRHSLPAAASPVTALAVAADGELLALGRADGSVQLLTLGGGPALAVGPEPVASLPPGSAQVKGLAFFVLPGGRAALATLRSYSAQEIAQRELGAVENELLVHGLPPGSDGALPLAHRERLEGQDACCLRASPAGTHLVVTVGNPFTVRLFETEGWTSRVLEGSGGPVRPGESHGCSVYSAAFSPDGAFLFTGGWNNVPGGGQYGEVRAWDVRSGAQAARAARDPGVVRALDVSPDGRWLVVLTHTGARERKQFELAPIGPGPPDAPRPPR